MSNELEKLNTYHTTFNEPKKTSPLFRVTKSQEHTTAGVEAGHETRHYSSQSLENTSSANRFMQDSDNNSYGGYKPEMTAHELRRAKREVYEKLSSPFYKIEYSEDYSSLVGEDVYFCTKANEAGYEVYVSHELSDKVAHIGTRAFTVKGDCDD